MSSRDRARARRLLHKFTMDELRDFVRDYPVIELIPRSTYTKEEYVKLIMNTLDSPMNGMVSQGLSVDDIFEYADDIGVTDEPEDEKPARAVPKKRKPPAKKPPAKKARARKSRANDDDVKDESSEDEDAPAEAQERQTSEPSFRPPPPDADPSEHLMYDLIQSAKVVCVAALCILLVYAVTSTVAQSIITMAIGPTWSDIGGKAAGVLSGAASLYIMITNEKVKEYLNSIKAKDYRKK